MQRTISVDMRMEVIMNEAKIREIATKTFQALPMDNTKPEKWIDEFVVAYTKAILFEATDIMREVAKEHPQEISTVIKATAIDVLDHFGL